MEYADGGTLAQFLSLRQGRLLQEAMVASLLFGITSAIEYVHAQNILHRDLKSENVFLTQTGTVKVGDFGIAKQLAASSKGVRQKANTLLGTPHYISPELCCGTPYDSKSDIWSLGCILYEMVSLNKAFESDNLPALVNKIMERESVPRLTHPALLRVVSTLDLPNFRVYGGGVVLFFWDGWVALLFSSIFSRPLN